VVRELLGKLKGLMDILVTWEPLKMVSFPYYPLPGTNIAPETVGWKMSFLLNEIRFLLLGGGFKDCLFSPGVLGEMIQFD